MSSYNNNMIITRSNIKKRDPNAMSTATWDNKVGMKKSLIMFTESQDFALSTKGSTMR